MDWHEWKANTFGTEYMIWHDGLDTGAVTRLQGREREDALEMLRVGVSVGDAHAAEALAAMGDDGALAAMKTELEKATGTSRVRLALSIHALAPDPALARYLVEVLHSRLFWTDRIDAAIGLRKFSGQEDELALLESVEADPDYLVRNHASDSLLVRWKIEPPEVAKHGEIFRRICGPPDGQPTLPEHVAGFREAREMLEKLKTSRGR